MKGFLGLCVDAIKSVAARCMTLINNMDGEEEVISCLIANKFKLLSFLVEFPAEGDVSSLAMDATLNALSLIAPTLSGSRPDPSFNQTKST